MHPERLFLAAFLAVTLFSTMQSAYCYMALLRNGSMNRKQAFLSNFYDWVAASCWAIIIVFHLV